MDPLAQTGIFAGVVGLPHPGVNAAVPELPRELWETNKNDELGELDVAPVPIVNRQFSTPTVRETPGSAELRALQRLRWAFPGARIVSRADAAALLDRLDDHR